MMKYNAFLVFFTLCFLIGFAQEPTEKRTYYPDAELIPTAHPMDFQHLKLEVSFNPKEGKVMGKVLHQFKVLAFEVDTVFLHAEGISIESATMDAKPVKYRKVNGGVVFDFAQNLKSESTHSLEITYTAVPKKGIYFIGWNDPTNRARKQIWTQGQGKDNRHWIPMYDLPNDKVTSEVIVTVEDIYKVLSNGLLKSQKKGKDGKKTWHYQMEHPHASYLIMLGIGAYDIKTEKSESGVVMNYYMYPDWADRMEPTYQYSKDMMRFMEAETGVLYPWKTYSQIPVQDFLYGAMENTTATIFGDFYCVDQRGSLDRNYVRVNAHELAHQWFGDYVTARTSSHHWLQESFATHYDLKYQGVAFGEDHFNWMRRQANNQAIQASLVDLKPLAHSSAGSARHYPKGSYVLEMLRYVAGNENYKKAIQHYLKKHAFGNVDSEDLLVAFHESTGLSLDWFWEEWIYKGGEPNYQVVFEDLHSGDRRFGRFTIQQTQVRNDFTGLFKMPIWFAVEVEGQLVRKQVWIEKETEIIDLDLPKEGAIRYALFDEGSQIMKSVNFEKPYDYLVQQALNSTHLLDRYDAVVALAAFSIDQKRSDLEAIYKKEKFHAIKSNILTQVFEDLKSLDLMKMALQDEDVEVRKTAITLIQNIHPSLKEAVEKMLTDSSYEVVTLALERLFIQFPENRTKYLDLTKNIEGSLEKNVRLKWLELAYVNSGDHQYINQLKDYTSVSFEFRTRVKAAETLKEVNYFDAEFLQALLDGLFTGNPRLRGPMRKIIMHFNAQESFHKMILEEIDKGTWNDLQQRRINSMNL